MQVSSLQIGLFCVVNLLNIRLDNIDQISIWFTATVVAYYQHFGQSAVRHPAGGATLQKLFMSAGNAQATTRQTKTWLLLPHPTE